MSTSTPHAHMCAATEQYRDQVEKDIRGFASKFRISGVPYFVVDGKYGVR